MRNTSVSRTVDIGTWTYLSTHRQIPWKVARKKSGKLSIWYFYGNSCWMSQPHIGRGLKAISPPSPWPSREQGRGEVILAPSVPCLTSGLLHSLPTKPTKCLLENFFGISIKCFCNVWASIWGTGGLCPCDLNRGYLCIFPSSCFLKQRDNIMVTKTRFRPQNTAKPLHTQLRNLTMEIWILIIFGGWASCVPSVKMSHYDGFLWDNLSGTAASLLLFTKGWWKYCFNPHTLPQSTFPQKLSI